MNKRKLSIMLAAFAVPAGWSLAQETEPLPEPTPPPTLTADFVREPGQVVAQRGALLSEAPDQVGHLRRTLVAAPKPVRIAQAGGAGEAPRLYERHSTSTFSGGGASKALVIPKEAGDAKSIAEVEEDLNVMAHILDKAVTSDSKTTRAMGIPVFSRLQFGGAQNLFIEGHGAILFLNVNFPLLAPPDKEREPESKDKTSSEWEDAKREVMRPVTPVTADALMMLDDQGNNPWVRKSSVEYDADRVEELKKDVLTALKNAAHIRKLKSDETITVIIMGARNAPARTIKGAVGGGLPGGSGAVFEQLLATKGFGGDAPGDTAKLIIRARKSDAESFQNGKLNFDDFRKRATVMIY